MRIYSTILFLTVFLLHTFSFVVIQTHFRVNRERIARTLCINRNQPRMQCKGNCYLGRQLKKQQQQEEQGSSNSKTEKFEIQLFCTAAAYHLPDGHLPVKSACFHPDEKTITAPPPPVFHPPSLS